MRSVSEWRSIRAKAAGYRNRPSMRERARRLYEEVYGASAASTVSDERVVDSIIEACEQMLERAPKSRKPEVKVEDLL